LPTVASTYPARRRLQRSRDPQAQRECQTRLSNDETVVVHNADGSTTQIGVQTSEISKQTLEKELFDVPAGYNEVKSLAELNGGAETAACTANDRNPRSPCTATSSAGGHATARPNSGSKKSKPSTAQMMNPASQLAMAQGQQMGMGGGAAASNLSAMMSQGGMPNGMAALKEWVCSQTPVHLFLLLNR